MNDLRETLERIVAPSPSPGFHDELSDRIRTSQRTSARRRRALALAAAAAAIASASAVGVFAVDRASGGTVVDRTISCSVITQLDSGSIGFHAAVKGPPVTGNRTFGQQPGFLSVIAEQVLFAAVSTSKEIFVSPGKVVKSGYFLNSTVCRSARAIPLSQSGLPSLGVFSHAGNTEVSQSCLVAANSLATIRLQVVLSGSGAPVAARLAVRAGKRQRPVLFIDWKPDRFTAFASAACVQQ